MAVHPLLTVFDEHIHDWGEALPAGHMHGGSPMGRLLTVFDECIHDRGETLPAGDVHGGPPAGHLAVRLHGRLVQQGRHDVRVAP